MHFLGRILLTLVGLRFGGFFGALFGFWLGFLLDKKLNIGGRFGSQASPAEKQQVFFDSTFLLMGHVAKADGVVSKSEIDIAKQTMQRLGLNATQTKQAQALFAQGKAADFAIDSTLAKFRNVVGPRNSLSMMFLEIQISAALADGAISDKERAILHKVCSAIGVPQVLFDQLVQMILAAQTFSQGGNTGGGYQHGGPTQSNPGMRLAQAYQTLGVSSDASPATIKRAYRKLLSEHHPDKLQAKGLPEEMMKLAAEKTHAIKQAYEAIKAARGFK